MKDIQHLNLFSIDLNLLVVFDALMLERSVTRAGEKVGLSQPATSNALNRLRRLFQDELFTRTAEGMQPTQRAVALFPMIRQILLQIESSLANEPLFNPSRAEQIFTIGMSDYAEFIILPKLMQYLGIYAPNIKIRVRIVDRQKAITLLDTDKIDLGIGFFPETSSWHAQKILFADKFVCVLSQNHPLIQDQISLAEYVKADHLLVSVKEDGTGRVDELLAQKNLKRNIAVTIPNFLAAPFIIANTHLVATLGERLAKGYAQVLNLQILPIPLALNGFNVSMIWHSKNEQDPSHKWIRSVINDLID
jgi:DNA-binding transcriptional LysR family regulator